jgi:hypothetical protein
MITRNHGVAQTASESQINRKVEEYNDSNHDQSTSKHKGFT